MRTRAAAVAGALLLGATAAPALAHTGHDRRPGATKFDLEVRISAPNQPAGAPHVVADAYGNLYAVARKETPASPDDREATKARASSWRWWSSDGGATWQALPGPPGEADGKVAGLTSDVAVDGKGHAYVVDSNIVLRYIATGRGNVAFDAAAPLPVASTATPVVAAHGTSVFVLLGATVYASYDSGTTFSPTGVALPGASDCRLAAGRATDVYATCLDGSGHVYAYASHDDARTFARTQLATYDTADPYAGAPPVAVTPDGTAYVLRGDTTGNRTTLSLDRSTDGGRTWATRRASDDPLLATHLALAASPDGRLGAAMYVSAKRGDRWFVAAGIFATTAKLLIVSFADHTPVAATGVTVPDGTPGATFLPDARLAVTWTVLSQQLDVDPTPLRDAWFVRSQPPDAKSNAVGLTRTPQYAIPPCTIPGQVQQVRDWQQIRRPDFLAREGGAGQTLVAYAVDPFDPRVMYATNGTSLKRSDDGGCRWQEVWSLEVSPTSDMPLSAATAHVTEIAVPEDRRAHQNVYLLLAEQQNGQGRAHVVHSPSGAPGTFALSDSGLPPAGAPGLFRVSGANPDFLYLTVANALYASEDAGATWTVRTAATDLATAAHVDVLTVDPGGPTNLYAVWSGTLHHSRDGGRTWDAPVPSASVQSAAGTLTAVDVFHVDGELAAPTVWSAPAGSKPATVLRSTDDGATWTRETGTGLEGPVESAVHGSRRDVLVVSTLPVNDGHAEIYARNLTTHAYVDLSPVETTTPFRVGVDRRGHPTFYGMSDAALFRYAGNAIEPPPAPDTIDDSVFTEINPPVAPPVVTPGGATVRLLLGTRATLPFTVDLAPRRPRIDVMFVTDTSESMTNTLPVVRRDLLDALRRLARVADVRIGIAQDKTDASPPIYRRERDVGPYGPEVVSALYRLDPRNAGGLETQLIGLDQIVTGAGLDACPGAVVAGRRVSRCLSAPIGTVCEVQPDTAGCSVRPGQQADFRDDAVKFVLDATDTTFRNPDGTPRGKDGRIDIAGVAAKYREAGILHVGLAVNPEGIPDLATMSRLTGAVAPASGLDCSGDGVADVRPGAPAVCPDAAHIDDVLMALFHVHAPTTHVHVEPPDVTKPVPALEAVTPAEIEDVDRTTRLRFVARVTVSCVALAPGRYDVPLDVEPHGETATRVTIHVDCVTLPVPRVPLLAVGVPLAVLPPNVPAAQPPPNLNVNAQTQVQTQVQPQAGAATQENEEVELVTAEADPSSDGGAARMLAAALGISAAAAYGMQRARTQRATARR